MSNISHHDNSLTPQSSHLVVRTKPRQDDDEFEELKVVIHNSQSPRVHHTSTHHNNNEFKQISPSSTKTPPGSSSSGHHHHLRKEASNLQIGMAITFFSVTSILSVFLTKYLMDMGEYSFHFPLTMAWFHLLVSLLCIICTYNLNRTFCFNFLPDFEFKFETAIQIAPVSLCYVGMVTFNNLCLDYADIHTYHTARSISICFTVLFTSVLLGERIQKKIIGACLMIGIGYFMTGFEELQLSKMQSIGFAFGLMSSCFMALYSIYLKKLMSSSHRNHWVILIYNVVCAILFLFPVCYFTGEFEKAISVNYLFEPKFLGILIATALIAYVVNISNFMLISYTSPLTTSVTISMKSVAESVLSYSVHSTHVSIYGLLSSAFTVIGTYLYSYFKIKDKREFEGLVD